MNPSEEFLRHAADCQRMAKFTRDPASKATWNRMAERWLQCAEVFDRQRATARRPPSSSTTGKRGRIREAVVPAQAGTHDNRPEIRGPRFRGDSHYLLSPICASTARPSRPYGLASVSSISKWL